MFRAGNKYKDFRWFLNIDPTIGDSKNLPTRERVYERQGPQKTAADLWRTQGFTTSGPDTPCVFPLIDHRLRFVWDVWDMLTTYTRDQELAKEKDYVTRMRAMLLDLLQRTRWQYKRLENDLNAVKEWLRQGTGELPRLYT